MSHVKYKYKYTYRYSGPTHSDSLALRSPEALPSRRCWQHRSVPAPIEERSARPLFLTVNHHHYGQTHRRSEFLPQDLSQKQDAKSSEVPGGLDGDYCANTPFGTNNYGDGGGLASELCDEPLPTYTESQAPHSPSSPQHNCIVSAPLPTSPVGCLIPGTWLALNIPRTPSNTPELKPLRQTGLTYGYIFPMKHAIINLLEPGFLPFDGNRGFRFQIYRVPTCLNLGEFIEQVAPFGDAAGNMTSARGIIECIKLDNRSWKRGQEFWIGGPRGDRESMKSVVKGRTLADVGWTEERSPIWVGRTAV